MARIAILDDYQNLARKLADWSAIERQHTVTVFDKQIADRDALAEALQPFDVVCLMRERTAFDADMIAKLPILKLIVTAGMRNAAIDIAAANERGIVVCGTPGAHHATAELTLGLMLSLARSIPQEAHGMRTGGWQSTVGIELEGKTLGIVGLGKLGQKVAGYGQALGMNVIAWSQNLTQVAADPFDVKRVEKDELFAQSDFLTIHLKLSERSRGLVGADDLARMKPTAYVINTSRGPIIDEAALLGALRSGTIAGCGLDVFDEEPLPADHPLRAEPRALLTPHLGYWTQETLSDWYGGMVNAVDAWSNGTPIHVLQP